MEKFIAYFPGTSIDLGIRAGQIILADEPLYHALRNDEFSKANVPKEYYGYEFAGTVLPVHGEDGSVCGAVCIQVRRQTELREIADQISVSLNQAHARIGHVAENSGLLADYSQKLLLQSETTAESVKKAMKCWLSSERSPTRRICSGLMQPLRPPTPGKKGGDSML